MKKKLLSLLVILSMVMALAPATWITASAADQEMTFSFILSSSATTVKVGDEITVQLVLKRTDGNGDYLLYSMQDEIQYDRSRLALVSQSIKTGPEGVVSSVRNMSDGIHDKVVLSFVDMTGAGATKASSLTIGTFQLKALKEGTANIENTDYKVNKSTGTAAYLSTADNLAITVSGSTTGGGTVGGGSGGGGSGGGGAGSVIPEVVVPTSPSPEVNCPSKIFTDVDTNLWYHEGIDFVLNNKIFNGVSNTSFAPNTTMTRGMIITGLYRMEGSPASADSKLFGDVARGSWSADAVVWGNAKGIVKGYDADTYGPNDPVTREQIAAIFNRYGKYKGHNMGGSDSLSAFVDSNAVSPWARAEMQWAVNEGILTGVTPTTLESKGYATRAQVAVMVMRFSKDGTET